jgi:subtilase family serine protease
LDDPIFKEFAAQGQNLFKSSGDDGAEEADYPVDDVYVVGVGGTHLATKGPGGAWQSEVAWGVTPGIQQECGGVGSGSGGGPSTDGIAIPSWQKLSGVINSRNKGSKTLRNVPDVAALADCQFYICANGGCGGSGGTSLAAPLWASFMALVNEQAVQNGKSAVGFLNPIIYPMGIGSKYHNYFHDITTGNNNNGNGQSYNAVAGYDDVTGWGSPKPDLIKSLAGSAK